MPHLNTALIEFPNNYLDTQDVLGNIEGGRGNTLKRKTDIKAMQVHGKCWKKQLSQCLSSKVPEVFFQHESIFRHCVC